MRELIHCEAENVVNYNINMYMIIYRQFDIENKLEISNWSSDVELE